MSRAQLAYLDGMIEIGEPTVADINDPTQLSGIGVFPVTIDEHDRRVSTSLAYLTSDVRARDNLTVRTGAEVATLQIVDGRAVGVELTDGEQIEADEIIVSAGAVWSPLPRCPPTASTDSATDSTASPHGNDRVPPPSSDASPSNHSI